MMTDSLTLCLSLLALCAQAAPMEAAGHGNVAQYGTGGGIVGFLVLLLDLYVFVELAKSSRPTARKFLWYATHPKTRLLITDTRLAGPSSSSSSPSSASSSTGCLPTVSATTSTLPLARLPSIAIA